MLYVSDFQSSDLLRVHLSKIKPPKLIETIVTGRKVSVILSLIC